MKKFVTLLLTSITLLGVTSCGDNKIDYSKDSNWTNLPKEVTKDVDTFFICPTMVDASENGDIATVEELREGANTVFTYIASVFQESTNVYMPLYRQLTFAKAEEIGTDGVAYANFIKNNITYTDICDALDYYFDNLNKGRPFILASHSQGSCISYIVLENYFKKDAAHENYFKRMVAAYTVGFAQDQEYFDRNTHLKFAEGESDCGVVVSWNTRGVGASSKAITTPEGALCINPINWKRDDTYASAAENKGSRIGGQVIMNFADAKLNTSLGFIETNAQLEYLPDVILGDKSLHTYDYGLYYNNVQENIAKRIDTYFGR